MLDTEKDSADGSTHDCLLEVVSVTVPDCTGVYVKVKLVEPVVGVTVTEDVLGEPTEGVNVPPFPPSDKVIDSFPLNVEP